MRKVELTALTGIRFYAALFVFLSHVVIIPGMEKLSGQWLVFNVGVVAVSFFFVLSGFILTYNYSDVFRTGVSAANYRRFVWGRLTKIYPVHLLTMLMALPIQIFSPNLPLDWRAVPVHLLLLQCFWPFSTSRLGSYLNVPSWSVSCEWFFYLLAPMAMFLASERIRRWAVIALTAGYACAGFFLLRGQSDYNQLNFVSWFAPSRFLEFLVGVFVAQAFMAAPVRKSSLVTSWPQVMGIAFIVAGALCRRYAPWPLWGGLLYAPGSALLIFGLAYGQTFLANHLSKPWVSRLGVASFSFYLIHAPTLRAVRGICLRLGWEVHTWTGFWTVSVGMFVLIQTIALIVCRTYEIPVQEYLRRLLISPKVRSAKATEPIELLRSGYPPPAAGQRV